MAAKKIHPNETKFRKEAQNDPSKAAHLKKYPNPVKIKTKNQALKEKAKSDPDLKKYLQENPARVRSKKK